MNGVNAVVLLKFPKADYKSDEICLSLAFW